LAAQQPASPARRAVAAGRVAAAPGLSSLARAGSERGARGRRALAGFALAGVTAATLAIVLGAAAAPSFLIYGNPSFPPVPLWLASPLAGLGPAPGETAFSALMLTAFGSYLAALALADALPAKGVLGAVAVLHAALLLAPPILSGDAFSYLAYARLYAVHGLDPYRHPAEDAPGDPLLPYVGIPEIESPYGPLFTLLTIVLVPLGPVVGMWSVKALAVLASLGIAALTWSCARRLGRPPAAATAFVALNPLLLVYAVGGAHNDLVMTVLVCAGLYALAGPPGRTSDGVGGAALATAAAAKATGGLVLPFAVLGARERRRALAGVLIGAAVLGALSLAAFGAGLWSYLEVLLRQGRSVSIYSVWLHLSRGLGFATVPWGLKLTLALSFLAVLAATLVRTWRGGDWIAAAGWALLALLVCTTWLLPWYVVLLLPLAALGASPRLRGATLGFCGLVLLTRLPLLFG
jgi:alpha-1,6-mannosyltransferase